uniref:phosphatidate phosphatase n=1 Tax=Macrostomum lignano TaxID=282301 RepID=A0A1I8IZG2_9PLAT
MNVVSQLWSTVSNYYRTLNPATLSGAIDVIVVEQPDGTLKSSPFHARFGKTGILRPQENVVDLYVNDELIPDIQMKLGEAGEAFFLEDPDDLPPEMPLQDLQALELEVQKLERRISMSKLEKSSEDATGGASTLVAENDDATGTDEAEDDEASLKAERPAGSSATLVSYYSDCEGEERSGGTSSRRATLTGYKSDSEQDSHNSALIGGAAEQLMAQMDWEWGKLPHSATMDSVKSGDYFDCTDEISGAVDTSTTAALKLSCGETSGYKSDQDMSSVEEDLNVGVQLSLCGGLDLPNSITTERFLKYLISYDEFMQNPDIIENRDLVVRIQGKNYNWRTAAPILLCRAVFNAQLPYKTVQNLKERHMRFRRKRNTMRSWFAWGRARPSEETDPNDEEAGGGDAVVAVEDIKEEAAEERQKDKGAEQQPKQRARTVRLSSNQLKKLNLRPGYNELRYSITTKYQGTTECTCGVYLWGHDDRIVISDIDGTITRSDVLGHILPMVGKDWTQPRITKLFSAIEKNDYRFLYLSARAIGQSAVTRRFLQRVRQEGVTLPDGPVLLSPLSLMRAFHQEVIARRPEAFKIACLRDVRSLFPAEAQPFWAGFGNRPSDALSYTEVSVNHARCFTVNPQGEVNRESGDCLPSSYQALAEVADLVFPPFQHRFADHGHFSHFSYWRAPLPVLPLLPAPEDVAEAAETAVKAAGPAKAAEGAATPVEATIIEVSEPAALV